MAANAERTGLCEGLSGGRQPNSNNMLTKTSGSARPERAAGTADNDSTQEEHRHG